MDGYQVMTVNARSKISCHCTFSKVAIWEKTKTLDLFRLLPLAEMVHRRVEIEK
jgi:hypothetical protein